MIQFILSLLATLEEKVAKAAKNKETAKGETHKKEGNHKEAKKEAKEVYTFRPIDTYFAKKREEMKDYKPKYELTEEMRKKGEKKYFKEIEEKSRLDEQKHKQIKHEAAKVIPFSEYRDRLIQEKVAEEKLPEHQDIIEIEKMREKLKGEREKLLEHEPALTEIVSSTFKNVPNIIRNAYDNTIGVLHARSQNRGTVKHYTKNPHDKTSIAYIGNGVAQNIGAGRVLGEEFKKVGIRPYHIKFDHNRPREWNADTAFKQIEGFHKKTKLSEPYKREDFYTGHSSGADVGIFMATDPKIKNSGIKYVQARAPAPYGIDKIRTTAQKIVGGMVSIKHDDIRTEEGRINAIDMYHKRAPMVPVDIYVGKYDRLITPEVAYYKHARHTKLIDHPDSTHFGTSGPNRVMSRKFASELYNVHKELEQRYRHAKAGK